MREEPVFVVMGKVAERAGEVAERAEEAGAGGREYAPAATPRKRRRGELEEEIGVKPMRVAVVENWAEAEQRLGEHAQVAHLELGDKDSVRATARGTVAELQDWRKQYPCAPKALLRDTKRGVKIVHANDAGAEAEEESADEPRGLVELRASPRIAKKKKEKAAQAAKESQEAEQEEEKPEPEPPRGADKDSPSRWAPLLHAAEAVYTKGQLASVTLNLMGAITEAAGASEADGEGGSRYVVESATKPIPNPNMVHLLLEALFKLPGYYERNRGERGEGEDKEAEAPWAKPAAPPQTLRGMKAKLANALRHLKKGELRKAAASRGRCWRTGT